MIKEVVLPEIYITRELCEKLDRIDTVFKAFKNQLNPNCDLIDIEDAELAAKIFYYSYTKNKDYKISEVFDLLLFVADYIDTASMEWNNKAGCYCFINDEAWTFRTLIKIYGVYFDMIEETISKKVVDKELLSKLCDFTAICRDFSGESGETVYKIRC